jgi:hypothetical protein
MDARAPHATQKFLTHTLIYSIPLPAHSSGMYDVRYRHDVHDVPSRISRRIVITRRFSRAEQLSKRNLKPTERRYVTKLSKPTTSPSSTVRRGGIDGEGELSDYSTARFEFGLCNCFRIGPYRAHRDSDHLIPIPLHSLQTRLGRFAASGGSLGVSPYKEDAPIRTRASVPLPIRHLQSTCALRWSHVHLPET